MIEAMPSSITSVDDSALVPVGTRTFVGVNEYIYLKGVASTVAGSVVHYDEVGVTALAVADGKGAIAIAQAAVVANKYGWYLINGSSQGLVLTGFADNGDLYLTATAGSLDDAVVDGDRVHNAWGRSAISSGKALLEIHYAYTDNILDAVV